MHMFIRGSDSLHQIFKLSILDSESQFCEIFRPFCTGSMGWSRYALRSMRTADCMLSPDTIRQLKVINKMIHPRGRSGGARHRKRNIHSSIEMPQPIQTIIGNRPVRLDTIEDRTPVLRRVSRSEDGVTRLKLQCALWNARSIREKISALTSALLEYDIDVFVITESWLKKASDPAVGILRSSLSGFRIHHQPRTNGHSGGGVAIVVRDILKCKVISTGPFKSIECLVVEIRSRSELLNFVLVYRPKSGINKFSAMKFFLPDFSTLLESVLGKPGRLLICGDFNIHMNVSNDADRVQFDSLLSSLGLVQLVQGSTHKRGYCLDLVSESDSLVSNVKICDSMGSDHNCIMYEAHVKRPPPTRRAVERRKLSTVDIEQVRDRLGILSSVTSDDVNFMSSEYRRILTTTLDELAPSTTVRITDKPRAPWWCDELHTERQDVRRLERKWQNTKLEIHRQIFHTARDEYHDNIKSRITEYHRDRIATSTSKEVFSLVDNFIGGKKLLSSVHPTFPKVTYHTNSRTSSRLGL